MSGGLEMSKRYIREDLERVTKHTLHIRDMYTYFIELGKKKHLKRLMSNKEYINILYSDLYRTNNI